jgi:hypothetical protein
VSAGYTTSKHKNFNALRNISFKEHLPEDGQSSWPEHVVGYATYNAINYTSVYAVLVVHIIMCHQ